MSNPVAQTVFDRLNNKLQQEYANVTPDRQHELLEQLGYQLRQWRIKQGYSRQDLAAKLVLDIDQLLCIENGIGTPTDITEPQLHTLSTLLTADELDLRLQESIQYYLSSLSLLAQVVTPLSYSTYHNQ